MTSSNSIQTVLSVRRILERILLDLDMRTLLTSAPRVNRFWNFLTRDSRPIQEALFFQPVKSRSHESTIILLNPLLAEAFPGIFQRNSIVFPEHTESKHTFDTLDMVKDPDRTEVYMQEDASWRYMLVQQPPARKLWIVSHCGDDTGFCERCEIQVRLLNLLQCGEGFWLKFIGSESKRDRTRTSRRRPPHGNALRDPRVS